jgi:hypothetical protein
VRERAPGWSRQAARPAIRRRDGPLACRVPLPVVPSRVTVTQFPGSNQPGREGASPPQGQHSAGHPSGATKIMALWNALTPDRPAPSIQPRKRQTNFANQVTAKIKTTDRVIPGKTGKAAANSRPN